MDTPTDSLIPLPPIRPDAAPIACSLSSEDLAARLESARALGERALVALDAGPDRARLTFSGAHAAVEELAAAERRCCGFLRLRTTRRGALTELEIEAPPGGGSSLRGLVAALVAGWQGGL